MMERRMTGAVDRRLAVGGGLAAAAGLAWPRAQVRLRVIIQRGVGGGGIVRFAEGEARFSLIASRMTTTDDGVESAPVFLGRLVWTDATVGYMLESVRITNYENLQLASGEGRMVEGVLAVTRIGDQAEEQLPEQPFVLEIRFDLPDSAPDRIDLRVGVAATEGAATPGADGGFTYAAEGDIDGGVLDADFAVNPDTGEVTEPEEE